MHLTRILLFTFLLLNTCTAAVAQQYRAIVRRYGLEDGLPHRQVNSITQDYRGFIWAATNGGGLARFDGKRFQVFNQAESGLGSDVVNWVCKDPEGNIWAKGIGAGVWLRIIEPVSGKVMSADTFFQKNPPPIPFQFWESTPLTAHNGTLAISIFDSASFMIYHPVLGWSVVNLPDSGTFMVTKITKRNTFWGIHIGKNEQHTLIETDVQGQILRRIPAQPGHWFWLKKGEATDTDGFFVAEARPNQKGMLWEGILWEIDSNGNRKQVPLGDKFYFLHQHARVKNGEIEVRFPEILDQTGHVLLDLSQQFPEIDPTQYYDYLLDQNGNIWFATAFGLFVVEIRKTHFRKLLYDEKAPGGRGKACRGLLEKNGRLLVNTELGPQGCFLIDPQTGEAQRIPREMVIGIAESSDGNVWTHAEVPYTYTGLQKITPEGQPISPALTKKRLNGHIWTILEDNPQRVLLGHTIGASVYNPTTGNLIPWHDDAYPEFDQSAISWLCKDRSGRICACTSGGLYSFQANGRVAERFWPEGKGRHYLPYSRIYHFYEDPEGIIWLGTGGGGLLRWDRKAPEGQQVQVIFRKNGLLNGMVYAVYEDAHEHLWLPTDYGIVQLDKKSLQVRHTWLVADGLTHNEFNRVSHCRGADGSLYFGGLNGVTAFHPEDFYDAAGAEKNIKRLVISNFSVWDGDQRQLVNQTPKLLKTNQFTVYPDNRYIQLEFALLEFVAPEKVTYTWKLEGISTDWEPLQEPVLRLSSLPYGSHHLRIRAQAADGTPAENELDILLQVMPPIYLRWWFFVLAGLLLAAGTWLWLRWRIREHRQEQERLEQEVTRQTATIRRQADKLSQLDQAKSRFFTNISHEFRTPLTVILGMADQLKNRVGLTRSQSDATTNSVGLTSSQADTTTSLDLIQRNGDNLLRLINQILDLSKLDSGLLKVHWQRGNIMAYLQYLTESFHSIAQERDVRLVFYPETPDLNMDYDAEKMQAIVTNLLSNALKFTPRGGKVVFHAKFVPHPETPGHLQMIVQDTGKGIPEAEMPYIFDRFYQVDDSSTRRGEGTGIGLAFVKELTTLLDGSISVESTEGKGTTFTLLFPCRDRVEGAAVESEQPMEITWASPQTSAAASFPQNSGTETSSILPLLLIVEDNADVATYLRSLLNADYQIEWAADGQAGIERALEWVPDIIISDVMMPGKNGYELCETLKNDERTSHIPIILLTAKATQADKLAGLRTGADAYLEKPFHKEELFVRLQKLVELRAVLQARYAVESATLAPASAPQSEPSLEDRFLQKIREAVLEKLSDSELDIAYLCQVTHLSHTQVFRKLKALTGKNPTQYIRSLRLRQALELLQTTRLSVSEVAYRVGFNDPNYFSRAFQKAYGTVPTEVRN